MGNIDELFQKQKANFKDIRNENSDRKKEITFRINQLKSLKQILQNNEDEIYTALKKDLSKPPFETYTTELGLIIKEIDFFIKNLSKWIKPEKVKTSWLHFKSASHIYKVPYGVVLIIAPWNYPLQLSLIPLVGAIAAGNCVILKPSEHSPETSRLLSNLIKQVFARDYIAVVRGEVDTAQKLLEKDFDYIFFTGSPEVGKIVMKQAADNLTPVTLELGGKSPCIVDSEVNLELAVRRIIWGKLLNAGQTCIAPDYLLITSKYKNQFIEQAKKYIKNFYGDNIKNSSDYSRIINENHFERLERMLNNSQGKVVTGGIYSKKDLYFSPTIVTDINTDDFLMKEEIFGPILPVLEFEKFSDIFSLIDNQSIPLALYLFTNNKEKQNKVIRQIPFGGGCINDTIIHASSSHLSFGGIKSSGLGRYHGKASFDTFTYKKSIMKKTNLFDLPFRYPPYRSKLSFIKKLFRWL